MRNAPTVIGEHADPDFLDIEIAQLETVQAPVLLTLGDFSPAACKPIVDILVQHLSQVRTEVIPDAGHVSQVTHPKEYAATLLELFELH